VRQDLMAFFQLPQRSEYILLVDQCYDTNPRLNLARPPYVVFR